MTRPLSGGIAAPAQSPTYPTSTDLALRSIETFCTASTAQQPATSVDVNAENHRPKLACEIVIASTNATFITLVAAAGLEPRKLGMNENRNRIWQNEMTASCHFTLTPRSSVATRPVHAPDQRVAPEFLLKKSQFA